jgi:hypothetical protein
MVKKTILAPALSKLGSLVKKEDLGALSKIKAYHGSPHKFDVFDLSKIGTGEGFQAFGHGLYFGGEPEVGENYKAMAKLRPSPLPPEKDSIAYDMEMEHGYGEYLKENIERHEKIAGPEDEDYADELIRNEIDPFAIETFTDPSGTRTFYEFKDGSGYEFDSELMTLTPSGERKGYLYEVELDVKPEELIDFDAPISEQPDSLKEKVTNVLKEMYPHEDKLQAVYRAYDLKPIESRFKRELDDIMKGSGWNFVGRVESYMNNQFKPPGYNHEREAAKLLLKHGIKGLKYKPGLFSPTGKIPETAKPNYVIYDDSLVNILKTLGVLGGIGVPLLMDEKAGPYASGYAAPNSQGQE